jgi:hypothetical protein
MAEQQSTAPEDLRYGGFTRFELELEVSASLRATWQMEAT